MTNQEVFALGSYIRSYIKKNKIVSSMGAEEVFDFLRRSEVWRDRFKENWDFYRFLKDLESSNNLPLLRCCTKVSYDYDDQTYTKWQFYGPPRAEVSVEKNSKEDDLYAQDLKVQAFDGKLLRSKQEVFIYNALRHEPSISVWYEEKLRLGNGRILIPDFTIRGMTGDRSELYWEHFGYYGESYESRTKDKLVMYRESGIHNFKNNGRLICTYFEDQRSYEKSVSENIRLIRDYFG